MSTDDVPDPLAGIDLRAWQPPPPPAGQIDSILSQVTEFTRVDGAPAMEIERDREPRGARAQRARWVVLGAVIGAAAAVIVMLAVWPRADEPAKQDDPAPIVVVNPPGPVTQPGGTVAPTLADCRALRDSENWPMVVKCANELARSQDAIDLAEQATREQANKLRLDELSIAIERKDEPAARDAAKQIAPDSVYYVRAQDLLSTLEPKKAPRPVKTSDGDVDLAPCEPDEYLDAAREAGASNQWSKMLKNAMAADTCKPSKTARKLALMAACKLDNKKVAKQYEDEFAGDTSMRQLCVGVVRIAESEPPPKQYDFSGDCTQESADALLQEARDAGSANQWSKCLSKAEASNKCKPSKIARQMALLCACQLGHRDKAMRYWKEFENNTGMQQRCIGIVE
jgi:hypothetical protein